MLNSSAAADSEVNSLTVGSVSTGGVASLDAPVDEVVLE